MLDLDPVTIRKARALARKAGAPVVSLAKQHTTVSVERAVLRLAGLEGADVEGIPWVNRLVDVVRDAGRARARRRAARCGTRCCAPATTCVTVAQKAAAGSVTFRVPEGRDATRAARASRAPVAAGIRRDRRQPRRARQAHREVRQPARAVDLPHRRHRRHLRGHAAGPGRRARGRRRHRGHPLDRPVAARLRARGPDARGVRRHLRDAGELPAHARGARRDEQGARPLRAAHQLRLGPVHARDRDARRARAARHDAQRLDVRDPLPRHQPDPHLRRPALLAARSTRAPASSSTPARTTTSPPPTPSTPRTPSP